ncbi:hypothetical protein [Metakosakonia massiliensis]|uniref:Uncharacterized protein n=1 Tax=Phytobacter massiliensis TaxID=1485952 RepID=A0A6N3E739_9ENTR
MTTSMYALSRSEQACLLFAIAFLTSAMIYGLLAGRIVRAMSADTLVTILQDCPVLLMLSLSGGFIATATGHYVIRQCLRTEPSREDVHD